LWAGLRRTVGCVRARDPAAHNMAKVLLLSPGVQALPT
jgi:hypothetical protein